MRSSLHMFVTVAGEERKGLQMLEKHVHRGSSFLWLWYGCRGPCYFADDSDSESLRNQFCPLGVCVCLGPRPGADSPGSCVLNAFLLSVVLNRLHLPLLGSSWYPSHFTILLMFSHFYHESLYTLCRGCHWRLNSVTTL